MRYDDNTFQWLLGYAYEVAKRSPDPSNQNGAVMFDDEIQEVIAEGWNDVTSSVYIDWNNREEKYKHVVHAETSCIYDTVKARVKGRLLLVCPWASCLPCAKSIVSADIDALLYHHDRRQAHIDSRQGVSDKKANNWQPGIDKALVYMENEEVELISYRGPLTQYQGGPIRVNEKLWDPRSLMFVENP